MNCMFFTKNTLLMCSQVLAAMSAWRVSMATLLVMMAQSDPAWPAAAAATLTPAWREAATAGPATV